MISFVAIIGRMTPNTLKLKGIIKNKNTKILEKYGSTHNLMDINIAKQLNHFVYHVKDLLVETIVQWDGHGVKRRMVVEIRHLCHKSTRAIYRIQMARSELQVIWDTKPTTSVKRTHKPYTSIATSFTDSQK